MKFSQHTIKTKKTVIFCRKLDDSSLLYVSLRKTLGEYFTFPIGYPDCQPYRVIDMFTRACKVEMKEAILKTFSEVGGKLRVVIATTAFRMGIDCSDIERIIHWGMPGSSMFRKLDKQEEMVDQHKQPFYMGKQGSMLKKKFTHMQKSKQIVGEKFYTITFYSMIVH